MRGIGRTWGEPTSCTIFYRHNNWYASITVKCEPVRATSKGAVGLDLGCKDAITFDDGSTVTSPKFYSSKLAQIKTLSKEKRRKRAPVAGAQAGACERKIFEAQNVGLKQPRKYLNYSVKLGYREKTGRTKPQHK